MEYIDDVLLKDYLDKQGKVDPEAAVSIIMPIIEAVKKIHSKGIIHRDISPDNIFITSENSIKVFDFGAAQLNDSREGMAADPVIKVGYSPLEQYRDKSKKGFYTDVYAVGAIFYQMLTGEKPIESTEREFKDELKSPKELGIKISGNMDRAVMEALSVRPELRFQGIQQFQEALQNKRIAEYPKEKIRKRKRMRNWTISLSALAAAAVAVGIGLYSTILKPQNDVFDTPITKDTQITVWVENEDQKTQIESLVENGFKKGESDTQDEKVRQMQQENEKVGVTVEVWENMETALQGADEDSLPNLFLSDHVSDLEAYKPVSMKENVFDSLNTEDYLFLSEYENVYGRLTEMPTGIDTLLLYTCQFDYHKDNMLKDSRFMEQKDTDTIELSEIVSNEKDEYLDEDKMLNDGLACFEKEALPGALLLGNNKVWKSVFKKNAVLTETEINMLSGIQNFRKQAKKNMFRVNRDQDSGIYGSNIVAGVAYRSFMNEEANRDGEKGANPLNGYQTYVVTQDGKMLVDFSEKYAITGKSSKNQKIACMRLLWVMMSEIGQAKKNAPGQTTYPILRSVFEEFPDYNANYDGFIRLVSNYGECVLLGSENRQAQVFVSGLKGKTKEEKIRDYCEEYVSE